MVLKLRPTILEIVNIRDVTRLHVIIIIAIEWTILLDDHLVLDHLNDLVGLVHVNIADVHGIEMNHHIATVEMTTMIAETVIGIVTNGIEEIVGTNLLLIIFFFLPSNHFFLLFSFDCGRCKQ